MKSIKITVAIAIVSGLTFFLVGAPPVSSQSLTTDEIEMIRQQCSSKQEALSRLNASDGVLRVNRGQLYESISTRLMARFNSRVASSRLDGGDLFSIVASYESGLSDFRERYIDYERALSEAMRINCSNQPEQFNDKVAEARRLRKLVHEEVVNLHSHIDDYRDAFESFAESFEEVS